MNLLEIKNTTDIKQSNIERLARVLLRDCRPFLEQIDYDIIQYPLYRGISKVEGTRKLKSKNARLKNRKPRDTTRHDHNRINKYFTERFGHPYRNGVNVSGYSKNAFTYGFNHLIFPINNFKFLWSPDITDLYTDFYEGDEIEDYGGDVIEWLKDQRYYNKDLKKAIQSWNEIMLWSKKYYIVKITQNSVPYLKQQSEVEYFNTLTITPEQVTQLQRLIHKLK